MGWQNVTYSLRELEYTTNDLKLHAQLITELLEDFFNDSTTQK